MRKPIVVLLKTEELTLRGIGQFYISIEKEQFKLDTLCDIYEQFIVAQCIIFANKLRRVTWLADQMTRRDFTVSTIHSELSQDERTAVMAEFKSGSSRVLIATDLVARGIDVRGVSLVINYDLPTNKENYIHRIGRSGRYGRKGVAINFVIPSQMSYLEDLQSHYETEIKELPESIPKEFC